MTKITDSWLLMDSGEGIGFEALSPPTRKE